MEWDGKPESVILTRSRGGAEADAEKNEKERTSAETAEGRGPSVRRGRVSGSMPRRRAVEWDGKRSELRSDWQDEARPT